MSRRSIRRNFLDEPARPSATARGSNDDDRDQPPKILVDCHQDEDNTWIRMEDDSESISSEGKSGSASCAKDRPVAHQQLWDKEDVILALTNLPAGEAALTILSSLSDDKFADVVEEVKDRSIEPSIDLSILIPRFANGCIRKASLIAENETALNSSPADLLIKWPNTCLLVSCWLGQLEIVKVLLIKGAQVSFHDADGRTPLHLASSIGAVEIVEELLKHGADPTEWDFGRKCTPLHCAAAAGSIATVQCLVKAGADINAGLSGKSPLYYAVQNSGQSNDVDCVKALLEAGASPNNPQVYTETPLHVAASLGSVDCVKLLLNYGADVRVQYGTTRSTALHLAAEEGSPECARLLLDAGAPPDARNSRGQTALHLAALAQSAETLDILIGAGARVNAEDDNEKTPLHAAVVKSVQGIELVRALCNAGAEVNKPDKFGYTPLHIAALNENSSAVIFLLSRGADVTARTNGHKSALSFIIRKTPDVKSRFVSRLDQAIAVCEHELGDVDCELRLDFRPLVTGTRGESDLMLCLIEVGERHVLKHPLCESFLYLKWRKIRKFFLLSLLFHSVFVTIFTSYVSVTYLWHLSRLSGLLFWFVLLFTLILASKEIFQIAHGIWIYAKGWENVLQWSVILTTAAVLAEPLSEWQHHIVALSILFVWLELMMVVGRFPMFGLYVQMFKQVAMNFFKFLGAYLCLIVGFALSFSVLHKNYKSFSSPFVGLIKTIVMLSGELEFEDVFFDEDAPILYPVTSHLMWLAFVILVTVILANLMMGLAVSDIQELRRSAGLDRLVRSAQLVSHLESLLFSKLLDYAPSRIVRAFRSSALLLRPPHHCSVQIRPNDPRENRLPKEIVKSIYRLVCERRTKSKLAANSSIRSLNGSNGFGFERDNIRLNRLYSNSSFGGDNGHQRQQQQQLSELAIELQKCSSTIGSKLEALSLKLENFMRDPIKYE